MSHYWQKLIDESSKVLRKEDSRANIPSALNDILLARKGLDIMEENLSEMNPEDSLPSWWTNNIAVSVSRPDGINKKVEK